MAWIRTCLSLISFGLDKIIALIGILALVLLLAGAFAA